MNDKLINKIKKILNLANNNSNEHEAKLALLRAQKIMIENKLTMDDIDINAKEDKIKVTDNNATDFSGKTVWWVKRLSSVIASNFRCMSYIERTTGKTRLRFIGTETDVFTAIQTFKFAKSEIEILSKKYISKLYRQGIPRKGKRNRFIEGFITGLNYAFQKQVKDNKWELAVVTPPEVNEFIDKNYNFITKKSTGIKPKFSIDKATFEDGFNKGKEFNKDTGLLKN
jgi:hypothetical protein